MTVSAPELELPDPTPEKVPQPRKNCIVMMQSALKEAQVTIDELRSRVVELEEENTTVHASKLKVHEQLQVHLKAELDAKHSLSCYLGRERKLRLSLAGLGEFIGN